MQEQNITTPIVEKDDNLKTLHQNLLNDNYDLPDYDTFKKDMENEDKMHQLHENLLNDNYDLPDYDTFRKDMGYGRGDFFGNLRNRVQKDREYIEGWATVGRPDLRGDGSSGNDGKTEKTERTESSERTEEAVPWGDLMLNVTDGKGVVTPMKRGDYASQLYRDFANVVDGTMPLSEKGDDVHAPKSAWEYVRDKAIKSGADDISEGVNSPVSNDLAMQVYRQYMRNMSQSVAEKVISQLPDHLSANPSEDIASVYYDRGLQDFIREQVKRSGGLENYENIVKDYIKPAIAAAYKKRWGGDFKELLPLYTNLEHVEENVRRREANKVVAPYLGKMVDDAFAVFDKKGAEAYRKVRSENEESSMFVNPEQQGGHILAGIFGAERAKIKASDPGKVREHLEQRVEQLYGDLVKNRNFQKDAIAKAEELGIPVMEYIQSYVLPGFADNLQKKFRETAVAREMPDSDLENILQGITRDSIFGMLFNKLLYSDEQREYQQEAMAKSDRGMWSNIGRMTAGMAADFWLWGGWGKIGAKAAQGIIKQRVASVAAKEGISEAAARVVVENEMKKFWTKNMIKNATPRLASSAVTLGGAGGATQPFVSGVLNGENPVDVIANTAAGFIGEVPVGLAFGLTGGMVHPLVERLTGIPKLFGKIGAYEVEAGTMYATGEMHKLLAGEAAFENPLEGMLESNISLAGIKLAQPHGVAKAWNSIRHPIRTTREAMQPSKEGYFTEDDIKSLESKTDSRNLLEVVKKLGSGEAVVREDIAEAATAYDTYMRDKDEPVSRKAKVANLFGKKAPVVGYEVSMEHFFDEDGNYIIRTRDMDGQCVNEYKFKNVEDGEAKETELKNTLYNNEVEALAERVNLWNGQRNLLSWQPKDEEMQRKVLTLNQHAEELVSIAEKQSSNEPLTADEQKLLNTYWDALAGYVRDGGAYKTFERNYEKQKGLQEGTLEKILKKQSKDYSADERIVVDDYKEALRSELPENPTPALPEGEGKPTLNPSQSEGLDESPTPTLYEGEGVTVAHDRQELFESGRRALLSADSEALRQIDMDVDLAAERVRRLQESGNADAEALAAAQEALERAEEQARGVRVGLQEMIEAQQRAIVEELEPMKSERGMIVPVTLHDGRQGFVKAGDIDVDNQYGSLFVTFERDGEWVTEQVSNNHIREVGESRSFDDMVSERSRVMEEETIARFQRISEGLDIEPGRQVSLTIGEVTAPFEVRGETSDGQVVLRDAAGEELAMPRSDVEAYLKATRVKEVSRLLDEEAGRTESSGSPENIDRTGRDDGEPPMGGNLQVDMDRLKEMALDAIREGKDVETLLNSPGVSEEMKEEVWSYIRQEANKGVIFNEKEFIEEENSTLLSNMVRNSEIAPEIALTPENWILLFGEDGQVKTPIGDVKMGENQYFKLARQGREGKLGMVKPTLENPDIIIEDPSEAKNRDITERNTSYVFVKAFKKEDGSRFYYFTSVTVSKGGKEVVVSNQEKTPKRISRLLQSGTVVWKNSKFSLHPNTQIGEPVPLNDSNKPTLTDNQSALLGINSSELSEGKDNENLSDVQENARESVEFIPGAVYDRDGNILLTGTDYEAEQYDRLSYINKARNLDDRYKRAKNTYNAFDVTRGIIEDYVPRDVYELVSANLPYRSIEWESLKKELGDMSRGVGRNFDSNTFNMFLSKKGEGRSFNKVVHDIWESRNDYDGGGADTDLLGGIHSLTDQDVRNALLEMLMSYSRPSEIKNLMLDNRINEAERLLNGEARYQEDAAQGAFYEMYRMSPEEYVSCHEAERNEQSRISDADIQEKNRIFAEKYLEDETRNQSRETGSLSSMDQDAEGRGTEGGDRRGGEELRRHDSEGGNRQYPQASEGEGREPGNGMGVSSSKDDVLLEVGRGTSEGEVGKPTEAGSTENTGSPEDGSFADRLSSAIAETETNPSEAQKKSGNYKKGHLSFGGYDFTVENPKGSVRRGVDATGKSWEQTMNNTYGYLRGKGMLGKDGDHLDVFINDAADLDAFEGPIFIIDQVNNDGKFDEHKIMYGFDDMPSAIRNYLMNYERPWKGLGNITEVDKATFDKWLESSDRKLKPFAETRFGDNRDVVSKIMDVGKNPSPARPEGEGENQTGRTIPTSQTEGIGDSTLTRPEGVGNVETDGGAAASVVQSSSSKIEDFGEKIGMARKDTAVKGVKKGTGTGEPAWKKKYTLHNLANPDGGAQRMVDLNGLVIGDTDYSKPFVAYYTKKAKSRWSSDRHYPIRDKDGNVMVFRSREEFDSVVPVWEVREQMYRIREKDGKFVITRTASNGKSVEYASFDTREEAEAYMTSPEGATSLLNHKRENFELPALERLTRVGMKDYRHGRNVSGQDMLDAFGFRGGEFGNWVNAAERQQFLNTAYDALMDLANLIGVSPRALSLNGELSIAFGARGSKGAKAHYEPSRAVINLTKMNGAGSLAHEFAHALDNYFGMLAKGVQREHGGENSHYVSEYTWSSDPKIRKEVLDVFKEIRDAMERKTVTRKIDIDNATDTEKKLRTSLDKAIADARAEFERGITKYVYNRKTRKRETQKIVPTKEQLQRFDELMKSLEKDSQWEYVMGKEGFRLTGETADAFYDLVKDVLPNKKGKYGPAHNVGYYMSRWKDANDYLERAKSGESETVTVDTKFYSDSKRADAGRAGSYFSTTKELLARAFETYLADKMSDAGKSSDYLTYKKGDIFEQLFGINVYPATEEAQRLSGLFDKLFSTIEERVVEDTGNVALYEKVGERRPLTEYDVVAVQGLAEDMNKHGVPVVVDEASEKLVDEVNGGLRLSRGQKRAIETAPLNPKEGSPADISNADGAKIQKKLESYANNLEKIANRRKNFIKEVANFLGAKQDGSNSWYRTFTTNNGLDITFRLGNHNATVKNFDFRDEDNGISIVISNRSNEGINNNGKAHVVEYFYSEIALRKAYGKPLADIVRSIKEAIGTGEYKDTTGLAEREEVNAEQIKLHKVYHGSGADFDAFDHSHMGEGEGAQAYGYGTYVTEVEGIGKTYATQGRGKFTYKGLSWEKLWHNEHDGKTMAALDVMERMENGMTFDDAVDDCIKSSKESAEYFNEVSKTEGGYKETAEHYRDKVKALEEIKAEDFSRKSNFLYTVEIPDDNGHSYLDWTKTIDKSDRRRIADVVRALEGEPAQSVMFGNYRDGWQSLANMIEKNQWAYQEIRDRLVQAMGGKLSDEQAVTALMRKAGFVGVKYPAEHMSGGRKDGAKNYVIFDESDLTITDKLRFFRTPNGEAYGFTLNGVIHIDPRIATSETPIHEYSHLWVDAMRKANPEEWESIKKMLRAERDGKLGEIWRQVTENYPELKGDDDALCEEILTHYSGKRGAERLEAEVRRVADSDASPLEKSTIIAGLRRLGEGIRRFWKWVADSFGIHYKSVDEVADRIMSDLAEGKNFKDVKEKESPVFYSNAERAVEGIIQEKATPEQWLKMIEKGGGLKAGEDKWLGLSDWLRERSAAMESQPTKKTITKQEVLDFIRENQVHVEEVNYTERREFNDNGEVVSDAPIDSTRLEYTTEGLDNKREIALTVPTIEPYNESDNIHFGDAGEGRAVAWVRFGETTDADGKRVLVIDEIQSKRHQDGREKGYRTAEAVAEEERLVDAVDKAQEAYDAYTRKMGDKYDGAYEDIYAEMTDAERAEADRLEQEVYVADEQLQNHDVSGIPDAPFEKNWHELAMKRMLRYAAENGYDKIAWTTGEQQAERYNIGDVVDKIISYDYPATKDAEGRESKKIEIRLKAGDTMTMRVNQEGRVIEGRGDTEGKQLADVVGKDLAKRIMAGEGKDGTIFDADRDLPAKVIEDDALRIGGEGMKGFYDQMLPRFMDKYGKKWGVKTGEVVLPGLGDNGMTMWSVDVTPEMRESVMKGQPMFMKMSDKEKEAEYRRLVDIVEKPKRIEKLRTSEFAKITGEEIDLSGNESEKKKSAKLYGRTLQGSYTNEDTGNKIQLQRGRKNGGINEVLQHNYKDIPHLKSVAAIPQIIEKSILISSNANTDKDKNPNISEYQHYVCGLKIGNEDYTVHALVAVDNVGNRYYDHNLVQIEKGKLLDHVNGKAVIEGFGTTPSTKLTTNSERKVNSLLSILQINPEEISRAEERLRELEAWNPGRTESSGNTGNGGQTGRLGVAARSAAVEAARGVGEQLGGVGVEVVLNGEPTDADKALTEEQRVAKGWYDPSTGKVYLNASRIESAEDAVRTVLHEKAGHEGLSALLGGQDGVDRWGDFIFKSADKELRRRMVERADAEGYSMADRLRWSKAAQEVFADIAMEGPKTAEEFSLWRKAKHYIIKALKALGIRVRGMVTDEDLRYYVMKTVDALRKGGRTNLTGRDENIGEREVENVIVETNKTPLPTNWRDAVDVVSKMNRPFVNTDQNKEIKVYNTAVKHSSMQDHSGADVRCMGVLDRIIKNAIKIGEQPVASDEIGHTHKVEVYYCPVNIDGKQYSARMIVKQYENRGKILEDFQLYDLSAKQKKTDASSVVRGNNSLTPTSAPVSAYKVKDLIHSSQEKDQKLLGIGNSSDLRFSRMPGTPARMEGESDARYFARLREWDKEKQREKWQQEVDNIDSDKILEEYRQQYEQDLQEWRTRYHIAEDATEPVVPDTSSMNMWDATRAMAEYRRQEAVWKTVPKLEDYIARANDEYVARKANIDLILRPGDRAAKLRTISANLQQIRRAMGRQRRYDKKTVDAVVSLAREYLKSGYGDNLGRGDIGRLLSAVRNATGSKDLRPEIDKIVNIMIDSQLRSCESNLWKLANIKEIRRKAVGTGEINVQGKLELRGQRAIQSFRRAIEHRMTEEEIAHRLEELSEKMTNDKEGAVMYEDEYNGLSMALQYVNQIDESRKELEDLKRSRRDAEKDYGNSGRDYNQQKELLEAIDDAMLENRTERIGLYADLYNRLSQTVTKSIEGAKTFIEQEKQRVKHIQDIVNWDLSDKDASAFHSNNRLKRLNNADIPRFFLGPTATFEQMMKQFGGRNSNGEGYLYKHFVNKYIDSTENEWTGKQDAYKRLDEKARELFGESIKRFSDLYALDRKQEGVEVTFIDNNEKKTVKLSQGNLLYIYMANKMTDGKMKLRSMGITEEDVNNIKKYIDSRFVKLGDWIQDVFLQESRKKYNQLHEKLFGAPMEAIDNYFPLKILKDSIFQQVDVGSPDNADTFLPSTTTGAIIRRRRNSLPLDIVNADALSMTIEHIDQMEKWAAFAEFNKDVNALLSYKNFRNMVKNMNTVYGAGDILLKNFENVAKIAAGTYRPKVGDASVDKTITNIAKGVTAAKISFRVFTAMKQILSAPAFLHDVDMRYFAKNSVNPYGSFKWAIENMPIFEKRWKSRQLGDTRLMDDPTDWKMWKEGIVGLAARWGMTPNGLVDAITCAVGARSIYESRYNKYIKYGYDKEKAHEKALGDAKIGYNLTQQSSEGAFVSTIQKDRTAIANALSVFRNSSMSYTRQTIDALRNLKHRRVKGYKEDAIRFMTGQFMEDGLSEEQARLAALAEYKRDGRRNLAKLGVTAFLLPIAWNLGGAIGYLILGDDDDLKKETIINAMTKGLLAGPIEGFAAGSIVSDMVGMIGEEGFKLSGLKNYEMNPLPLFSDLQKIIKDASYDEWAAIQDMVNVVVQSVVGVNPETVTDIINAAIDYSRGDMTNAKEITLFIMRVLNFPQSGTTDNIYIDELGMNASEAKKLNYDEMAKRYADYKFSKNAPLVGWLYDDAIRNKKKEKLMERFDKKVSEHIARLDDAALARNYDNTNNANYKKLLSKEVAKRTGEEDKILKNINKYEYDKKYILQRQYKDILEDLEIEKIDRSSSQEEIKDIIKWYKDDVRDLKKELLENERPPEEIMNDIRLMRKELLEELRKL